MRANKNGLKVRFVKICSTFDRQNSELRGEACFTEERFRQQQGLRNLYLISVCIV